MKRGTLFLMVFVLSLFMSQLSWSKAEEVETPQDYQVPLMNFDRGDNENSIVQEFPELKKYIFEEPESGFLIGFGVAPVGIKAESFIFMANFFQLHWMHPWIDWEILSSSFGILTGESSQTQSFNFVFRSAPKFRVFENFSVGVLGGVEFVQYPEVEARIYKDPYATRNKPFSNSGTIWGLIASENFKILDNEYLLKLNQIVYFQSYSVEKTTDDWEYLYKDDDIRADTSPIEPGTVLLFEASLLF